MCLVSEPHHSALRHNNKLLIRSTNTYMISATGKRVVHMRKFQLNGDREEKEASLFIVPINVKGKTASTLRGAQQVICKLKLVVCMCVQGRF